MICMICWWLRGCRTPNFSTKWRPISKLLFGWWSILYLCLNRSSFAEDNKLSDHLTPSSDLPMALVERELCRFYQLYLMTVAKNKNMKNINNLNDLIYWLFWYVPNINLNNLLVWVLDMNKSLEATLVLLCTSPSIDFFSCWA